MKFAVADGADVVHAMEVFGPVATLLPYRSSAHALELIRRGQGSLVSSIYGSDPQALADAALALADSHGRVHSISPEPLPRSSTRAPDSRRSAAPRVASFSGVNGLWMR